jgi:cytochrome b subunit of formate dehydrogenase
MIIFPETPYAALWSPSTCRQLARYSAVLCLLDIPLFIWSLSRSKTHSQSNLFRYIDVRSSFSHLVGSYIATNYFYYLPRQELSLPSVTLFVFLFFIQGVVMFYALPVAYDTMVKNEKWNGINDERPCSCQRKGIWWIWTTLCVLGSWGLWIAFAISFTVYHIGVGCLDWLLFILFRQ